MRAGHAATTTYPALTTAPYVSQAALETHYPTSEAAWSFPACGIVEHTANVAAELLSDTVVVVVGRLAPGVAEARRAVVVQAVPGVPDAVESVDAVAGHVARPSHPVQRKPFLGA